MSQQSATLSSSFIPLQGRLAYFTAEIIGKGLTCFTEMAPHLPLSLTLSPCPQSRYITGPWFSGYSKLIVGPHFLSANNSHLLSH